MDAVRRLAETKQLFLLEDCAQAHGATLHEQQVGTFGEAAAFSFFPGKNLGAWGDAGAMVTGDEQLARRARMISQHGQTERKHEHQIEGRNSRMDGLQAAILSAKLRHLAQWNVARRERAAVYRRALSTVAERMQDEPATARSVYHLFVLEVPRREALREGLAARGIASAVHYPTPLPLLTAYERFGHRPGDFPVASRVTERILSLPLYPELTDPLQEAVITAVRDLVACRGGH
jgi:dTDP-4-amino-4,6-dideoxygalactose transaminase